MEDNTDKENLTAQEKDNTEFKTARDETGARIQIPYRQHTTMGYPDRQSSSRFINSGVREMTTKEEMVSLIVDARLKVNDVITVKNELGSSFFYQITDKPKTASIPEKENNLLSNENSFLKRLTMDEYQNLKSHEVPIIQKEKEIEINKRIFKNLTIEPADNNKG